MSQAEQHVDSKELSWLIVRFFKRLYEHLKKGFSWLLLEKVALLEDESGELMRRVLAQKSWFDSISAGWLEQSLWVKFTVASGFSLAGGIVGLGFSAPLLLMSLAFAVSIIIHVFLLAHEHSRIKGAQIMAQEAIALNEGLRANQQVLREVIVTVDNVADELTNHREEMKKNVNHIAQNRIEIEQHQEVLAMHVGKVTQATQELVKEVAEKTQHVQSFRESVQNFQTTQQAYAQMVTQFGIFISEQHSKETQEPSVSESDSYWDALKAELDENEELIKRMRQNYQIE